MSAAFREAEKAGPDTKYDRLIAAAKAIPPAARIVVPPCDESSLRGVAAAAKAGIIEPILVGPSTRIRVAAFRHSVDGSALAKNRACFARADGAGIVPGAGVPIVLTSRADTPRARLASCAVATLDADARWRRTQIAAA